MSYYVLTACIDGESELVFDNDVQSGYLNIEDMGEDIVEVSIACGLIEPYHDDVIIDIHSIPKSEMIKFLEDALSKLKGEGK